MRLWKLVFFTAIGLLAVSCASSRTSVVIKQGNPQQFYISGCGTFDILAISGPDYERRSRPDRLPPMKEYWVIQSNSDIDVNRLPKPIVYGQVPPGFRQYTPANSSAPPILEGASYIIQIGVREKRCGGINMWFSVRDGKITTEADAD